ncbi:hypothetical protein QNI16_27685 [Cytophagaceae bacterium YF14B1]|uniref:Phosphatase n=1 Tax=Xanthocytophaga flava TaxID=3048013 RepID=A0AAE3QVK6_9BACT|nr:hypothetical protein [Xanthocytophaga flavus]MDJ1484310.1 hypothetical protein [Xanthocytophaga flavus]
MKNLNKLASALLALSVAFSGCDNDNGGNNPATVQLKNHSNTPAFVTKKAGFEGMEIFSLISSDDTLEESPNYIFGGTADGLGLLKSQDGKGFVMMVNNEDNFAVSRITLDQTFKPVKGEYVLNSDGGQWRLCSGTLATPQEHGFGPLYLSVGESNVEAQTHGLNPYEGTLSPTTSRALKGLGHWSGENAVPLHKDAYSGKTVIIIGEDASDATGGQVAMYVSNTVGDLDNGSQYMLRRVDQNQTEIDMKEGQSYDVEFVKIDDYQNMSGAQIQAKVDVLKAIEFGRVEDIDYRKGSAANAREIYFNVTGQGDKLTERTKFGRVYKLALSESDPLKGKLTVVLDGDLPNGKANEFQNPDNICVTQNYVYTQEDSNGYGNAKGTQHDGYLWQYTIATGELKKVLELDHHRTAADKEKYNRANDGVTYAESTYGSWEFGALVDASDLLGIQDAFILCVQPHTWKGERYKNPDKGTKTPSEMQGSEILVVKGLPR